MIVQSGWKKKMGKNEDYEGNESYFILNGQQLSKNKSETFYFIFYFFVSLSTLNPENKMK